MKNDKLLKLGIVIFAIIFIIIAYRIFIKATKNSSKIDISGNEFYQYFTGIKNEYSGKMKIESSDNNQKTLIIDDTSKVNLDATPMYYKNEIDKVLLPSEMEIVYPSQKLNYKLQNFTVLYKENKEINVKKYNSSDKKSIEAAFLYDGQDMYFFLEETKIVVGDEEYIVSPLSYVYVSYRDYVEIYNYEKDEVIILQDIEYNKDIIAYCNEYMIDMSIDFVDYNNSQQLLITKFEYLKDFEY